MSFVYSTSTGDGPPVVFLHGFCDTHEVWTEFVQPFARRCLVITPDLPGFGLSTPLRLPFTIDKVAEELLAWMDREGIKEPIIIGHSLGGYIALAMLGLKPASVGAIGLFHSTALPDTPERKEVRNKVIEFVKNNGVIPYVDTLVPGLFYDKKNPNRWEVHERAARTMPDVLTGYAQAMRDRPDRTVLLSNNDKPKLILGGMQDAILPIQTLRDQYKVAKNALFYELDEVGHMGVFEAKSKCQAIITSFTDGYSRK